jgi:RNA polymerase sigma-70 factor, ECF subfamily
MLRAWKGRAGFEGRSMFRTWLYRIATNACLDALEPPTAPDHATGSRSGQ